MKKQKVIDRKNIIFMTIALILICISIKNSYSKYFIEESKDGVSYIASFDFESSMSDNINLKLNDIKPGDVQSYNFKVSNSKELSGSDVDINYEVTIKTSNNLPLKFFLYKNGDTSSNKVSLVTKTLNQNIYKMELQNMAKNQLITDTYELRIMWDDSIESNRSDVFVDELDYIELYIDAVQVEPGK